MERRKFLRSVTTTAALASTGNFAFSAPAEKKLGAISNRFKISLNAYSFNDPLKNGKTTLEDLVEFCAREQFEAIDTTGYYFPGYPEVPKDDDIYRLKRKAHGLGIAISGTGIRNEFAEPDKAKRTTDILMVKNWIEVAAKLGAPVIRIFSGKALPDGHTWEEVEKWILDDISECVAYGKKHGVIVALQNHNDFVKTADQALDILKKINSEWFGLVLDTGSFVTAEPYGEIKKAAMSGYAVNWQIKEKLNYNGKSEAMDLEKLFRIIHASPYRGYLPIETLSPGDPFQIVPPFLKQVRAALEKTTV